MSAVVSNFERKEVKYRLSESQYSQILRGLSTCMEPDSYGRSGIESIYYDTPERAVIARSLERPRYKEKLRVRTYETDAASSVAYVELKKKVSGIVYKRRVQMSVQGACAYLAGCTYESAQIRYPLAGVRIDQALCASQQQIAREIDAFMKRHPGLSPSMAIEVERTAWRAAQSSEGARARGLRITFDEDARYRDLFAGAAGYRQCAPAEGRLIEAGEALMEVKCAGAYPLWLVDLLASCEAYPVSFSKYGEAYKICKGSQEVRCA